MNVIEGGGLPEPDWTQVYSDELDQDAARDHWGQVVKELTEAETLAMVNAHQVFRLVAMRVVHDRAARVVADQGAVLPPKRGSKTAIARTNPHFEVQRQAASDCDRLEAELGISPRRRNAAGKVDRKKRGKRAADAYLQSVPSGR